MCPFRSVRQYHRDGAAVTLEFSLGSYQPAGDIFHSAAAPYTQVYGGGTDNRQAVVRFVCNHDPKPSQHTRHLLHAVSEPKPNAYEFTIKTTTACQLQPVSTSPSHRQQFAQHNAASSAATPLSSLSQQQQLQQPRASPKSKVAIALNMMSPLSTDCIYHNAGWWTYKFCYLSSIHQFHRETVPINTATPSSSAANPDPTQPPTQPPIQTKVVTTAEYELGHLSKDVPFELLERDTTIVKGASWELSYVSQNYTHGSQCEVANVRRSTEVRVFCSPHDVTPVIRAIDESSTCQYVLQIATHLICTHSDFAPTFNEIHEIVCAPKAIEPEVAATPSPTATPPHFDSTISPNSK